MPRSRSHTPQMLTDLALKTFWSKGFEATSMDDLVQATGISRHGIYSDFGGKRELFLACFQRYQDLIVTPAFGRVEQHDATLTEVQAYFEHQISLAEKLGLPGPGCFVGNSMTEIAPHDSDVLAEIKIHNDRLYYGFVNAIQNSCTRKSALTEIEMKQLAEAIVIFANGLWAMSRIVTNSNKLRDTVSVFLNSIKERL